MDYDDALRLLGDFGRYQKRQYMMVCFIVIPVAIHSLAHVFIAAKTDHWCLVPVVENCTNGYLSSSLTKETCKQIGIEQHLTRPTDDVNTIFNEAQCGTFNDEAIVKILANASSEVDITSCTNGWLYDYSQYKSTIIQEFDLVCDDSAKPSMSQSVFFAGTFVGSLVFGALADKFGRKPILFVALGLQCVSGFITAFSQSVGMYTALRFITAAANVAVFITAFVIGTETVGVSRRTWAGLVIEFFFAFGIILMAGFAYFIREWRTLQLVISLPSLVFFIYIPFLPESARWLISQKRYEEAKEIVKKAANVNNVDLPKDFNFEEHLGKPSSLLSFIDLFRTWTISKRTLNVMFCWIAVNISYFGLSLSSSDFGVNHYTAFLISGAIEIPAYALSIAALDYFGRRRPLSGTLLLGGLACLLTIFIPIGIWRLTVAMIGKFGVTAAFGIIFFYTAELYPTNIRSVAVGICSTSGRIGAILSPYILHISKYWQPLSMLTFSVFAIASGLLVLLLPETANKKLPETMKEAMQLDSSTEKIQTNKFRNNAFKICE